MAKIHVIKETKNWDSYRVRNMCIKNNYYTRGDNEAYGKMLEFVDTNEPDNRTIYKVALDIVRHSDMDKYGCEENELVAGVMYELANNVVKRHFEIQ